MASRTRPVGAGVTAGVSFHSESFHSKSYACVPQKSGKSEGDHDVCVDVFRGVTLMGDNVTTVTFRFKHSR